MPGHPAQGLCAHDACHFDGTRQMINADRLHAMKRGMVNTARGGLIDEDALVQALHRGQVRAAGLDVLALEPAPAGNPLITLPNGVGARHVAWMTPQTLARSMAVIVDNCQRLDAGQALQFEIELPP